MSPRHLPVSVQRWADATPIAGLTEYPVSGDLTALLGQAGPAWCFTTWAAQMVLDDDLAAAGYRFPGRDIWHPAVRP